MKDAKKSLKFQKKLTLYGANLLLMMFMIEYIMEKNIVVPFLDISTNFSLIDGKDMI